MQAITTRQALLILSLPLYVRGKHVFGSLESLGVAISYWAKRFANYEHG